jgi:hypothetical protein
MREARRIGNVVFSGVTVSGSGGDGNYEGN